MLNTYVPNDEINTRSFNDHPHSSLFVLLFSVLVNECDKTTHICLGYSRPWIVNIYKTTNSQTWVNKKYQPF